MTFTTRLAFNAPVVAVIFVLAITFDPDDALWAVLAVAAANVVGYVEGRCDR